MEKMTPKQCILHCKRPRLIPELRWHRKSKASQDRRLYTQQRNKMKEAVTGRQRGRPRMPPAVFVFHLLLEAMSVPQSKSKDHVFNS